MEPAEELKKYRWSWWGQRAHDALGFSRLAEPDLIVCCDWGSDIIKRWGREKVVSLQKEEGQRRNFSNKDLKFIFRGGVKKKISEAFSRPLNCLMYRSIESLERAAEENKNLRIISSPVRLKNKFDDKVLFRQWLKQQGIPAVPGQTLKPGQGDYGKIKKRWGTPFVLQFPVGSSGENTFLVQNRKDFEKILSVRALRPFIVFRYIKGFSLNINAVVGADSTTLSPVSLQVIGAPSLTGRTFGFAGNDFSAAADLPRSVKEQIYAITRKTGHWMSESGFRGMMGLDFICDGENVYPVEINPRFQNSTSLLTLIELNKKRSPLVLKHIAEFIPLQVSGNFMFSPRGSQLILHSLAEKKVEVKTPPQPGVYEIKKGNLNFLRKGFSLSDCRSKDEFVLCSGVPLKGCVLMPSAPLLKIHFPRRVLAGDCRHLKKPIELTVEKIYNKIIHG